MATTSLVKQNDRKWQETLKALGDQFRRTKQAASEAAGEYLLLAQMFVTAKEVALSLDNNADGIRKRTDAIYTTLGVSEKSTAWISKLVTVGKQYRLLNPQQHALPPAIDSLWVIAKEAKKDERLVAQKLRDGVIHAEMSITDVRKVFGKKTRRSDKRGKTIDATLSFSNEDDAIRILAEALRDTDATVRLHDKSDKVRDALKAEFSKDWWGKHGHRVS